MAYVFDTNSFSVLGSYYPEQFPSFWREFEQAVAAGKVLSVREVYRELAHYARHPHLTDWVKSHRSIFTPPTPEEMQFVSDIFSVPHFQMLVNEKTRLNGRPVRRSVYRRTRKSDKRLCCHRGKGNTERRKNTQRLSAFWS